MKRPARKPRSAAAPRAVAPARVKAPEVAAVPLPANWRTSTWQVPAMLAKIAPADYERTAREFEADARGKASADWTKEWKAWCHRIMIENARPARVGLFD
jgi:hypothetical protein